MKFILLLFLYFNVFAATKAPSHQIEIQREQSSVEFVAIGRPSALKIRGEDGKPEGILLFSSEGKITGEIKVNLDDFSTGISLRDKHMKEKYLETQKPENRFAILKINKLDLPNSFWKNTSGGDFSYQGELFIHGTKKEISGTIKIEDRKADSFSGKTTFPIKLSDFGIEIPKFSGITVAENVEIEVKLIAKTSPLP